MTYAGAAVVVPWVGEFGWAIIRHFRYFNWLDRPRKIACCPPDWGLFYPTADEIWTDYVNPIPDSNRCVDTGWTDPGAYRRFLDELKPRLADRFPGAEIIEPDYGCPYHMADAPGFKFCPRARPVLPAVDVALSPRQREFDGSRNWPHWACLAGAIRKAGLTVGILGREASTFAVPNADAYAWQHPDGDTAGSVDLLGRCRLYVGTDSGLTHLAALMDVPTLAFLPYGNAWFMNMAQRANKTMCAVAPPAAAWWNWEAAAALVVEHVTLADRARLADGRLDLTLPAGEDLGGRLDAAVAFLNRLYPVRVRATLTVTDCDEETISGLHAYRDRFWRITPRRRTRHDGGNAGQSDRQIDDRELSPVAPGRTEAGPIEAGP